MKTFKKFFFIPLLFLAFSLKAQVFIGGDFNITASKSKLTDGSTTLQSNSSYTFSLYPFIGKFTSEKFAIGVSLHSFLSKSKMGTVSSTAYTVGVSPFIRYYAINWNKFSIYGVGNVGLDYSKSSIKTTEIYVNFYPGLSYNLNDRFSLETGIGILNLGFSFSVGNEGLTRDRRTNFNFGGGLHNISSIQNIIVGAIYKFNK